MAKAVYQNSFDSEGRKLGEQTGLDTPVVPAVNNVRWVYRQPRVADASQRNRETHHLGSMVARLKLKGIGGGAPQQVEPAV